MLLRSAAPEDALAVAQVHVRSWQAAYRELLPKDYLDQLRPEQRAKHYDFGTTDGSKPSTIVAVEDDTIVGFATVGPAHDPDVQGSGELCALYIIPEWWGRQLGRALIEQGRSRLRELGYRDAVLWMMVGNARAERFYIRDGWHHDASRRTASIWGIAVDELRYTREFGNQ